MTPEESRKEFEAFILTTGRGERFIERFADGSYIYGDVKLAWEAWCAALEIAARREKS